MTAAASAPKLIEAQTAALKGIQAKAAADQAALPSSLAVLNQAKATVDKLKAAAAVVRQLGK